MDIAKEALIQMQLEDVWFYLKSLRVANISGRVLHLSTIGSFLGSVLTTLIFMDYFGVSWTIFINYGLFIVLLCLLVNYKHKKEILHIGLLVLMTVPIYLLNI